MKQSFLTALILSISLHSMAFNLSKIKWKLSGDEIKEKLKTIHETCSKQDKKECLNEKKDLIISGVELPSISIK